MTLVTFFFMLYNILLRVHMLKNVNNAQTICICQYIVVSLHRKSEMT